MLQMKIVSVDPGKRHLGLAIYENGALTHFDSYDLYDYVPKRKRTDYSFVIHEFIEKSPQLFKDMDVLLIENQMKSCYRVISASFRCFFFQQAIKVSPLAVRKYFKISHSNYKKNKAASVKFARTFLNKTQLLRFEASKKKDDMADAIIMIQWYLSKKSIL